MPVIAQQPVTSLMRIDFMNCGCRSQARACAQRNGKFQNDSLSCTEYCICEVSDTCNNPLTSRNEEEERVILCMVGTHILVILKNSSCTLNVFFVLRKWRHACLYLFCSVENKYNTSTWIHSEYIHNKTLWQKKKKKIDRYTKIIMNQLHHIFWRFALEFKVFLIVTRVSIPLNIPWDTKKTISFITERR